MKQEITPEIAECVGLWLAEGDNKTDREITFTNNCSFLIEFFAKSIQNVFKNYNLRPRVYIYSSKIEKNTLDIDCQIKQYVDKRARNPYSSIESVLLNLFFSGKKL